MSTPIRPRVDLLLPSGRLGVTTDVLQRRPLIITRARQAEASQSVPTRVDAEINNRGGRYSPRNPLSPLYGQIGRNTQAQAYLGTPHLGEGGGSGTASTSHVAPSVTATGGGLLVCAWMSDDPVEYTAPDGMDTLAETTGTYSTQRAAYETVTAGATGTRTATASASAGYSSVSAVIHGSAVTVEETLEDADNQLGSVVLTTSDTTQAGWWLVAVQGWLRGFDAPMPDAPYGGDGGWILLADSGRIDGEHSAFGGIPVYLRQRIWARRVNCSGAQRVILAGAAGGADADNQAALLVLSGVDDWDIRATVEIPAWPPRWDVSGSHVWVPVEGAGILRRLQQGSAPLRSPLRRALTGAAATVHSGRSLLPVAYWPLEDAAGSQQAASALPGGAPLIPTDTIQWSSIAVPGSASLPDWSAGAGHLVGPASGVTAGADWGVGYLVRFGGTQSWDALRLTVEGGRWGELRLILSSSAIAIHGVDADGVTEILSSAAINDDASHWVEIWSQAVGSTVLHTLRVDGVAVDTDVAPGAPGLPLTARLQRRGADTAAGGHLGVWEAPTSAIYGHLIEPAMAAHAGEAAGRRFERLCHEEGIVAHIVGDPDDTTPMGEQPIANLLSLLRECEEADLGILYEPREALGLAYRTRRSRYNQVVTLALDYAASEVAPPLEPTDDDRYTRNDVTAIRSGGSSYRYEVTEGPLSVQDPPDGVGRYDHAVTVSVHSDALLPDQASARAHIGTTDELRYPTVRVNLRALGEAGKDGLARAAAALDAGDRLTIADPPVWLGPDTIDQQVEGYVETLGPYGREIVLACVPAEPYTVGVIEDEILGRADTDGMELAADFDAGTDTSMSVTVTAGPDPILTSTHGSMFDFDIKCGGVILTVTGISGSGPFTFTVLQDPVNGVVRTIPAGTPLSLAHPWRAAL